MKLSPGTNKKTSLPTGKTEGEPKETAQRIDIPEDAEDVTHTIRQISNGYIRSTSFRKKKEKTGSGSEDREYVHTETYHATDPVAHVKGIKSK